MTRRQVIAVCACLAFIGLAFYNQLGERTIDARPAEAGASAPVGLPPGPVLGEIVVSQIVGYTNAVNVATYVHAVQMADVATYVSAVAAANTPPPAPEPAPQRSSGSVGDCTGFSVPDWIIQRESGGNPNAVNPSSGAYGCSQTLPGHYRPGGACAGLDMYSVDGQRQCTWILSDGGTNLQPWAL